jgi:MerR family transcriptional regulator, light-induced transcriptional regulator
MTTYDGSMTLPDLKQYSDQPTFNTKAVVLQTGVTAPTLRAWERRYAVLIPERANNTYRLYSERHIALIHWLKERVDSGISISQAAALFRHLEERGQYEEQGLHPVGETAEIYFDIPADNSSAFELDLSAPDPDVKQFDTPEQRDIAPELALLPVQSSYSHISTESVYPTGYTMHIMKEQLIGAFQDMDEQAAQVLMGYVFSVYSVEQVCCELITPTLWEIGSLWTQDKLTLAVEHFASNFFRAILLNLFHVTRASTTGPRIIACCAPGELHELSILMLALFLRRSGMCVFYLGQNMETASLIHTIEKLAPAAVCVSLTRSDYLPALKKLARQIHDQPEEKPLLFCGGQAFCDLAGPEKLIPDGIYLNGDLQEITTRIQALVLKHPVKQSVR